MFSTKTLRNRGKDLPANGMMMLDHYWPDRNMDTTGWRQLLQLIRTEQNRYLLDAGKEVPVRRCNRPRHTGCTHERFLKKERRQFLAQDDHGEREFEDSYIGLSTRKQGVKFLALYPHSMTLTKEDEKELHSYLVKHELIEPGDPLPARPDVQKYIPVFTKKEHWKPNIPLNELRDLIFERGMVGAAEKLGTYAAWLSAMCRVLRVPVPPSGRSKQRQIRRRLKYRRPSLIRQTKRLRRLSGWSME